jgi:uncharacterized protein
MDDKKFYKFHEKYSRGVNEEILLDLVWTHSLIIRDIAMQLVESLKKRNIKIDEKQVEIGALVHDIGCYRAYEFYGRKDGAYVQHGTKGYEILRKEGFSEEIARMAMIHLGVGLVKENIIASKLPFEKKDLIPITLEEELVAYADNFHSKAPKFFTFKTAQERLVGHWLESGIIFERFRKKFGEPGLKEIKNKYGRWQKEIEKKIKML